MKRILAITVIFLICTKSYAAIDDNIDYNFVNSAFSNPNQTTNKDFENLMYQYEHPKDGFFTKMFKFFDKDKVKYDEAFKKKYENANNQPTRIKDVPEQKPTVLISASSKDANGNFVAPGYYQVGFIKDEETGNYFIELMQGANKHIAALMAKKIDEDEKSNEIVYGRAEALQNGYIKVIFANLDMTLLGFLKIVEENQPEFKPY